MVAENKIGDFIYATTILTINNLYIAFPECKCTVQKPQLCI